MSIDMTLAAIKLHVSRLNGMLADPHPGLFTWMGMLDRELKWLADFREHGVEYADEQATRRAILG